LKGFGVAIKERNERAGSGVLKITNWHIRVKMVCMMVMAKFKRVQLNYVLAKIKY
jgi:hypothetical protein